MSLGGCSEVWVQFSASGVVLDGRKWGRGSCWKEEEEVGGWSEGRDRGRVVGGGW